MPFYKIYAGLGGGFGGADYRYTDGFRNRKDAEAAAYVEACDTYWMHEGSGIEDWNDFYTQGESEVDESDFDSVEEWNEAIENWATEAQRDDMETWIEYWTEEADSLDDGEE